MARMLHIPIPTWAQGERVVVIAGMECLAIYDPSESTDYVRIKDNRCSWCGECCRNLQLSIGPYTYITPGNVCLLLQQEPGTIEKWSCILGGRRPLVCCVDAETRPAECTITHVLDYDAIESNTLHITIPGWAEECRISFISEGEIFAFHSPAESPDYVRLKDQRCSNCGECCKGWTNLEGAYVGLVGNQCGFLEEGKGQDKGKWFCTIISDRCLLCCLDPNKRQHPSCTITDNLDYDAVEVIEV